jgi:hypothetical protein
MTPKLGRLPRLHDPNIPQLEALRKRHHHKVHDPAPVTGADWLAKVDLNGLGMMLNDTLGCCVEAGSFHAIQVLSSYMNRDGLEITETDACVLKAYEEAAGYNPADPATDQGTDMQTYLKYWLNTGIPTGAEAQSRHKLVAFIELDPKNHSDVLEVIEQCGFVYLGFNVPSYMMGPPDGGGPPLGSWTYPPAAGADTSIVGGHCVAAPRGDADGLFVVSWGGVYEMSWGFLDQYCDEAYAVVDLDWGSLHGTPLGIPLGVLAEEMKALAAPT